MTHVVSDSGQSIRLGREVGRGGEGSVFEVQAEPHLVAKIYHSMVPEKAEKIRVMAGLRTERIDQLTAWPIDLLSRRSGEAVGVLMPRVVGHQLVHELYNPKSRRHTFLRGDWRFLIRAAANTARAFAVVHDAGCVIGDVNHGGILVADDATVRLIDCDSFQVIVGTKQFLCDVGIETFTPPELQGKPFRGVVRSQNHDNFGLAVLVFLMLFMGRHPFAGRFLGRGEMPVGKAIAQGRFAFGAKHNLTQMEVPPGAPDLAIVGDLGTLFEQAFSPVATLGGRPTADEWVQALTLLERSLTHCAANASHWYRSSLPACPWCAMEAEVGIPLFPVDISQVPGSLFDIDALWREIRAIGHPAPLPVGESLPAPSSAARSIGRVRRLRTPLAVLIGGGLLTLGFDNAALASWRWLLGIGAVVAFVAVRLALARKKETEAIVARHEKAAARWEIVRDEWVELAGTNEFEAELARLERLTSERSALPALARHELERLRADDLAMQLQRFLDRFEIAPILEVNARQKEVLALHGVKTAADVTAGKLAQIRRLGRRARIRLEAWRRQVEKPFVFELEKSSSDLDVALIEHELVGNRRRIERDLVEGVSRLKAMKQRIDAARRDLADSVAEAKGDYLRALADFKAAKG